MRKSITVERGRFFRLYIQRLPGAGPAGDPHPRLLQAPHRGRAPQEGHRACGQPGKLICC